MIGNHSRNLTIGKPRVRRLLTSILLVVCCLLLSAGCTMMPKGIRNLPTRFGMKTKDAEFDAKVEKDKFPTAKQAGI